MHSVSNCLGDAHKKGLTNMTDDNKGEAQRPQAAAQSSVNLISWFIWFSLAAIALTAMLSGNG